MSVSLPIDQAREELLDALKGENARVLIKAPTGSGKSTRVPQFAAEALFQEEGRILVIEPRRIAARLLASYVAKQMGRKLGDEVGYVVRFDRRVSERTRIIYMTDGVFQRLLMTGDQMLKDVRVVVFDEFHERGLVTDLCLSRILDIQEKSLSNLAVIVMSATIEMSGLSDYMGDKCRVIEASGRMYPVEIEYRAPKQVRDRSGRMIPLPVWEHAGEVLKEELSRPGVNCGDVLIFMPGAYEIRKTIELLESRTWLKGRAIHALHGSLSPDQQVAAITKGNVPKIIVSTNVAETSLTIEGVRTVIDSGLVRRSRWDARRGMNTLLIEKSSRSSADQRAGRAGRVAEGRCIRLWSRNEHTSRDEFDLPEVYRVDLSEAILSLKLWGIDDIASYRWLDAPDPLSLNRSLDLLIALGAIGQEGVLTETGREMMRYPLPPRLARMLVSGTRRGIAVEAAALAALLQSEHVAMKSGLHEDLRQNEDYSDFQMEWRAVIKAGYLSFDPRECGKWGIMARAAREVGNAFNQIKALVGQEKSKDKETVMPDFDLYREEIVASLLKAYPDHVGVRNNIAVNTCRLVGGKNGKLDSLGLLGKDLYFVSANISEIGGRDVVTKVGRNTIITPQSLASAFPDDFSRSRLPEYDSTRKRVVMKERVLFRDLLIEEKSSDDVSGEDAAGILAQKIEDGVLVLTHWNYQVEQWIYRLNTLSKWMPELEMPAFQREDRLLAFESLCEGATSYKEIKGREIMPILNQWLSSWQHEVLERLAPVSIKLENGQQVKIKYQEDFVPIISIQVQKLFGVDDTPVMMEGKCPLTIEILAPNQRPWQVTSSLDSFWRNGYPAMKKDLAGRYPKHRWPEPEEVI